jgi:MoaA/NifB/PqqE/SkfB family radical SAM enzyme
MCPIDQMQREKGYMKHELFISIIDQLLAMPDYTKKKRIVLHGTGEPLLSKDFLQNVEYPGLAELANNTAFGIREVDVTSNGVLMTEQIAERLLCAKALKWIRISLNSSRRNVYNQIQRKGNYDVVIENIRMLKRMSRDFPVKVNIQYLQTSLNIDETQQEFESVLGFAFDDKVYWTQKDGVSYGQQLPKDREQIVVTHNLGDQKPLHCFPRGLIVMWDGTVVGCCIDYDNLQPCGNLQYQTVKEVVSSNYIRQLAREYNKRNYSRLPMCKTCRGINV